MTRNLTSLAAGLLLASVANAQAARDFISIVGSSTVYPFTTTVAEQFGRQGRFKAPKVESTGTGGGIKLFCNGIGVQHPDVVDASRRIRSSEVELCSRNGVKDIVEVKIGYDGLVIANSKRAPLYRLTQKDIYLALASRVPDPKNPRELVANPHATWQQVNRALPAVKIEVLGPPPTSGTRDSFAELFMEVGCDQFPWIKALKDVDERRHREICHTVREDGAYVEAGENDNLIVQKLVANPDALGVFGYSYLEENLDRLHGALLNGVAPDFETISAGTYPASRPLFIYVKKAHIGVIPGLREFVAEYVSDRAIGEEGYLPEKGLIPPTAQEGAKIRSEALALKSLRL